jgi:hypothetical protein
MLYARRHADVTVHEDYSRGYQIYGNKSSSYILKHTGLADINQ